MATNETSHAFTFTKFAKLEHGFAAAVPDGWAEFPALLSNSPYEVARFARRDHTHHLYIVFRMPGSDGLDPRVPAEQARTRLTTQGFDHFAFEPAEVAGRTGIRLSCDKANAAGLWAARLYFASAGNVVYCLGLASGDPAGDAALFDSMGAAFEITN